jgi:hypothetical protein
MFLLEYNFPLTTQNIVVGFQINKVVDPVRTSSGCETWETFDVKRECDTIRHYG